MQTLSLSGWAGQIATDVDAARTSIVISAISCLPPITPNTGLWSRLWRSYTNAAERGVSVTFILPRPAAAWPATLGNLRAASRMHLDKMSCRFVDSSKLLHAKSVTIDNQILWIGSGNQTGAAANHNHEFYVRSISPENAKAVVEYLYKISA
jgi:phosphatidylserine/phosphatidylglycerophosphate/cardiolipin synthase-like enzyme